MTEFDTYVIVDWSAAQGRKSRGKDAIWIGAVTDGNAEPAQHHPTRLDAERALKERIIDGFDQKKRILLGFDFPFSYPTGFAEIVTNGGGLFDLWDWFEQEIEDAPNGKNNRFEVADRINAMFPGVGPFWGKFDKDKFANIPYFGSARNGHGMIEWRHCDQVSGASSSVWQLAFPPTVGSQTFMGLPMLSRLRKLPDVAVWPFEDITNAQVVLAEIWPGLIEPAVQSFCANDPNAIRDAVQVDLLAKAFSGLNPLHKR